MAEPRTAIVTGAGKRVGACLAESLIGDGWRVVAHVHHQEDEVPEGAIKVVADLVQRDCADAIFAAAGGPVSLLVNNAARFAWDSFGEFDGGEFDAHMAINVRAPALLIDRCARAHAEGHAEGADALVVNLLDSKLAAPNADYLSYTISKQALAALTELAARALAPRGIRVNAIAPGLMLRSSGQSEENFASMHADNPLRRGVDPHHIADALRYFIGATRVTGQTLLVDSGHHFLALDRDVQFLDRRDASERD